MKVSLASKSDIRIVNLQGELDLFNSRKLKEAVVKLYGEGATRVVVNFEDVSYIDSAGVGTLLFLFSEAKKKALRIYYTNMHGTVKKVITLTKLEKYLPIFAFLDEAIKTLST